MRSVRFWDSTFHFRTGAVALVSQSRPRRTPCHADKLSGNSGAWQPDGNAAPQSASPHTDFCAPYAPNHPGHFRSSANVRENLSED